MKPANYITISDCPFSGLKRAVRRPVLNIDADQKTFSLTTYLTYFNPDANEQDGYGKRLSITFQKIFIATNNVVVDRVGNPVDQPADGVNYFGEYDFFNNIAHTQPVIVADLLDSLVTREDQRKQFDIFTPYSEVA